MSQIINKLTGEIYDITSLGELVEAWREVSSQIKDLETVKNQLKPLVDNYTNEMGKSEEYKGYMFTTSNIQRQNYDKAVMRQVLDEDTFDLLLTPDKKAIDNYLKELVERGDSDNVSGQLRKALQPTGKPYSVTKLVKL